jgi:hypothetical protein
MRLDERVRRRIARLPTKSAVLLICADQDVSWAGRVMLQHCSDSFGSKYRFQVRTIDGIQDLPGLLKDKRHQLLLLSPLSWEGLPSRFRRLAKVSPAFYEPNPRALEEMRLAAGVLL